MCELVGTDPEDEKSEESVPAGNPRSLRRTVRRGSRWIEIDTAPERETR